MKMRPLTHKMGRQSATPAAGIGVLLLAILSVVFLATNGKRSQYGTLSQQEQAEAEANRILKTPYEIAFVPILAMQRTASKRLLKDILNGTCYVEMGEIFKKSHTPNGGAWDNDALSQKPSAYISAPEYVDFFLRTAQKRCRRSIEYTKMLPLWNRKRRNNNNNDNDNNKINATATCQQRCIVGFMELDHDQQFDVQQKVWSLLPNRTAVVLERDVASQWRSNWLASQSQSSSQTSESTQPPPISDTFADRHVQWYSFIRQALSMDERVELTFEQVTTPGNEATIREQINAALPPHFQGLWLSGTNS